MRLLVPLALVSCTPIVSTRQELQVRHDTEGDRHELVLVYEEVHARPPATARPVAGGGTEPAVEGALDEGEAWLRRLAAGQRVFVLGTWPLVFDLEEAAGKEDTPRAVRELLATIEVLEAELFLDGAGRLGARQRVRWDGLTAGLATLSEELNGTVLADLAAGEEPGLGEESRALLEAHAQAGREWVSVESGVVELHLPMTLEELARAFELEGDGREAVRAALHTDRVEDDRHGLRARYEPDEDGVLRIELEHGGEYDDGLAERVEDLLEDR